MSQGEFHFFFPFIPPVIGVSHSQVSQSGQDTTQEATEVWVSHELDSGPSRVGRVAKVLKNITKRVDVKGFGDWGCYLTVRCSTGLPRHLRERRSPPRPLCDPTPEGWSPR